MKRSTKVLIGTGVAAFVGVAAVVGASQAGRAHFGGHGHHAMPMKLGFHDMRQHVFAMVDADGDHKLTQDEIDAARAARRAKYDTNGDGDLSLVEFSGLWTELTEPLRVRGFQFLDADGNGQITKVEIDKRLAGVVQRFDRNGDGALSMEDRGHRYGWRHHDDDDDDDDDKGRR